MSTTPLPLDKAKVLELYKAWEKTPTPPKKSFEGFYEKMQNDEGYRIAAFSFLHETKDKHGMAITPDISEFVESLKKKELGAGKPAGSVSPLQSSEDSGIAGGTLGEIGRTAEAQRRGSVLPLAPLEDRAAKLKEAGVDLEAKQIEIEKARKALEADPAKAEIERQRKSLEGVSDKKRIAEFNKMVEDFNRSSQKKSSDFNQLVLSYNESAAALQQQVSAFEADAKKEVGKPVMPQFGGGFQQVMQSVRPFEKPVVAPKDIGFWENTWNNLANGNDQLWRSVGVFATRAGQASMGAPIGQQEGAAMLADLQISQYYPANRSTKKLEDMSMLEAGVAGFAQSIPVMAAAMIPGIGTQAAVGRTGTAVLSSIAPFISGFEGAMKTAEEAGVTGADKYNYAALGGLFEALSERILPDYELAKPLLKKGLTDIIKRGAQGMTAKDFATEMLDVLAKGGMEVAEEALVEFSTAVTDFAYSYGKGYEALTPEAKSAKEYGSIALAALIGAGVVAGTGSVYNTVTAKKSAIAAASNNPGLTEQILSDLVESQQITEVQAQKFMSEVNSVANARSKMPKGLDGEQMVDSAPLIERKQAIDTELEALNTEKQAVDEAFRPAIDERIKALEDERGAIDARLKEIAEKKAEEIVDEAQEIVDEMLGDNKQPEPAGTTEQNEDIDETKTEETKPQKPKDRQLGADRIDAMRALNEEQQKITELQDALELAKNEKDLQAQLALRDQIKAAEDRSSEFQMAVDGLTQQDFDDMKSIVSSAADSLGIELDEDAVDAIAETQLKDFVDEQIAKGELPDGNQLLEIAREAIDIMVPEEMRTPKTAKKPQTKTAKNKAANADAIAAAIEASGEDRVDIEDQQLDKLSDAVGDDKKIDRRVLQRVLKIGFNKAARLAEKIDAALNGGKDKRNTSSDYGNYLLDLIEERQKQMGWKDYAENREGLAQSFEKTKSERDESRAISNLEEIYMGYLPEGTKAGAYQALKNNYETLQKTKVNPVQAALKPGTPVEMKTSDGRMVKGEAITIPGYEDFDFIAVRDGFAYEIYDLYTGRKLADVKGAFSEQQLVEETLEYMFANNLSPQRIIKAHEKAGKTNESPAVAFREEQKRLEAENAPLLVSDPALRQAIENYIQMAEDADIPEFSEHLKKILNTRKALTGTQLMPTLKGLETAFEGFMERKQEKDTKEKGLPLKPGSFRKYMSLDELMRGDYKDKSVADKHVDDELREAIADAYEMESKLYNHFGYFKKGLNTPETGSGNLKLIYAYYLASANAKSEERNKQAEAYRQELLNYKNLIGPLYNKVFHSPESNPEKPTPPKPQSKFDADRYPVAGQHESHPEFQRIKAQYDNAPKYTGRAKNLAKPDGTKVRVVAVLVSAKDIFPSHNPRTFAKTPGVPVNEAGKTLNDRDYERDNAAQAIVADIAQNYGIQALQFMPVVTPDGIVVSGNNRVMSRQLSAENKTDEEYLQELPDRMEELGIPAEALKDISDPVLVYQLEEPAEYTTAEYRSWNASETKEKSPVEEAIGMAKSLTDEQVRVMIRMLDSTEIDNAAARQYAGRQIKKFLLDAGLVQEKGVAKYFEPDGSLNISGQELAQNLILATVLSEDQMVMINKDGFKRYRQTLAKLKFELLANMGTAPGFKVMPDLMAALELSRQIDKQNTDFVKYMNQTEMFGDKIVPTRNQAIMYFAMQPYTSGVDNLRDFLSAVNHAGNPSASQSLDMFGGELSPADRVNAAYSNLLNRMANPPTKEGQKPRKPAVSASELQAINALQASGTRAIQQTPDAPPAVQSEPIPEPAPSEAKKKRQRKIQDADNEVDAAAKALLNHVNSRLSAGFDPDALRLAANLTKAYVRKGLLKIEDILEDIYIAYGADVVRRIGEYVKASYATVRSQTKNPEMNTLDEVRAINIESYVQQLEREDAEPSAGEAIESAQGDPAGVPGETTAIRDPRELPSEPTGQIRPGSGGGSRGGRSTGGGRAPGAGTNYSGSGNPGINEDQGGRTNGSTQPEDEGAIRARGKDYVSPPDFAHPASFSKAQRFDANIRALETLVRLKEEGRMATPEEQNVLSQYAGWGGMKFFVEDPKSSRATEEARQFADRITRAHELIMKLDPSGEYLKQAKDTISTSFYTARPVIRAMHEVLKHMGFQGGNILEPSAGTGEMKAAASNAVLKNGKWMMVEIDGVTSEIAKQLHPSATVTHSPFEKAMAPRNFFDVSIANFPFGNIAVSDYEFSKQGPAQKRAASKIHNYFALKTLENLRPGGISMFITTHSALDNPNDQLVRDYLQRNAKILGAVRLPNTAFVSNANTKVVTDLIVIQKPLVGEIIDNKIDLSESIKTLYLAPGLPALEAEMPIYYQRNPQYILGTPTATRGQFGMEMTVDGSPVDQLEGMIADALKQQIPEGVYTESRMQEQQQSQDNVVDAIPGLRNGNLYVKNGQIFVYQIENGVARLMPYTGGTPKRVPDLIKVRDALNALVQAELNDDSEEVLDGLRKTLNREYDRFVNVHGARIRATGNQGMLSQESDRYNLMGLEKWSSDGKTFVDKADIFKKRVLNAMPKREPGQMEPRDAVVASISDFGRIDMGFVAKMVGKPKEDILQELGLGQDIFELPNGGYELKEYYLSGNIYDKLDAAEAAALVDPERYQANVNALRQVLPVPKTLEQIIPRFGTPFVSALNYTKMLEKLFNSRMIKIDEPKYKEGTLEVDRTGSNLGSEGAVSYSVKDSNGNTRMDGLEIVDLMLQGKPIRIYDRFETPDGKKYSVLNEALTARANQVASDIQRAFEDFLYSDSQARQEFESRYNRSENADVKPVFDGSWLTFPGMSQIMAPRKHQLDGVAMVVLNNGGYIDHMVGAGKTLLMIAAAMKLKQTGVANKVVLSVLKSTVGQISETFQALYPGAKILTPRSVDFEKKNRNIMLGQIANNDWDVVILTHEQLSQIPVSPEREQMTMRAELDELAEAMAAMDEQKGRSGTKAYQELQKRREKLSAKMQEVIAKTRAKQDTDQRYFEQLGIDHIMIDEAHMFKNLAYVTAKGQMSGLGSPAGNAKTQGLLAKIRFIQDKLQGDKGITFLSGTPVTNSIAELYNIFKYLRPNELARREINTFDAFTNRYAIDSTKVEFDVSGRPVPKLRLREFIELQALSLMYRMMSDVRNDSNLTLPKPGLKDGRMTMVTSESNELEEEFAIRLMHFAATKADDNSIFDILELPNPPTGGSAYKAKMLLATTYASKAAIDLRLIYPNAPYNPNGKIGKVVSKVKELYDMSDGDKGAQLIFSDIGVPKSENPIDNFYDELDLRGDISEEDLRAAFAESLNPETGEVTKYKKLPEIFKSLSEYGYDTDELDAIYQDVNQKPVESNSFKNVYVEVKKRLMESGIPEHEIQFIHDWKSDARKAELMAKVVAGEVRVVLGGTKNLGTGVNVQDKLVAVHHLDVPWTPAALDQRNGRLVRQGAELVKKYTATPENPYGVAEVFAYTTPKTLDGMKYELLATKHSFATRFRTGQFVENSMKDSEDDGDVLAEMAAAIMGDTRILDLSNLHREFKQIENEYKSWQSRYRDALAKQDLSRYEIEKREKLKVRFDEDLEFYNKTVKRDADGKPIFEVTIGDKTYGPEEREQAGTAMINLNAQLRADFNFRNGNERVVGSVYGFDYVAKKVYADVTGQITTVEYFIRSPRTQQVYNKSGSPTLSETKAFAAKDALDRLEGIHKAQELNENAIRNQKELLQSYERVLNSKFERSDEMRAMELRIAELTNELGGQGDVSKNLPPVNDMDFRQFWSPDQRRRRGLEANWQEFKESWDDLGNESLGIIPAFNPFDFSKEARFVKALVRLMAAEVVNGMKTMGDFLSKYGLSPSKALDKAWQQVLNARQYLRGHKKHDLSRVLSPSAASSFFEEVEMIIDNSSDILELIFNINVAKTYYANKSTDPDARKAIDLLDEMMAGIDNNGTFGKAVSHLQNFAGDVMNTTAQQITLSPEQELSRPSVKQALADAVLNIHRKFSRFEPLRKLERKLRAGKPAGDVSLAQMFETGLGVNARAESDLMSFYKNVIKPVEDQGLLADFELYLFWMRVKDRLTADADLRKVGSYSIEQAESALGAIKNRLPADQWNLLEDQGRAFQNVFDSLLLRSVEANLLSPESYAAIKEMNDFYVGFQVVMEAQDDSGPDGQLIQGNIIKRIKGIDNADFKLRNILEVAGEMVYKARKQQDHNMRLVQMANTLLDLDKERKYVRKVRLIAPSTDPVTGQKTIRFITPKPRPGYGIIYYRREGKMRAIEVDKWVADAFAWNSVGGAEGVLLRLLNAGQYLLKQGATALNVSFLPVNLAFYDAPRLALMSKYGIKSTMAGKIVNPFDVAKFVLDITYSFATVILGKNLGDRSRLYEAAVKAPVIGEFMKQMVADYQEFAKTEAAGYTFTALNNPEAFKEKLNLTPRDANAWLQAKEHIKSGYDFFMTSLVNPFEQTTKFAALQRAKRIEGIDDMADLEHSNPELYAEVMAEIINYGGSPNFLKSGASSKWANSIFPYFMARLNSITSDAQRLLFMDYTEGNEQSRAAHARLIQMVAIPAAMIALYHIAMGLDFDDEDSPYYVPDFVRANNFIIMTDMTYIDAKGRTRYAYYTIPVVGAAKWYKNGAEAAVQAVYKQSPTYVGRYAKEVMTDMLPVNIGGDNMQERFESFLSGTNPIFKTAAEVGFNRNLFYHREIVPAKFKYGMEQYLPDHLKYNEQVPMIYVRAAKALNQRAGIDVSPHVLEQAAKSISADLLTQFVPPNADGDVPMATKYPFMRRLYRVTTPEESRQFDKMREYLQGLAVENIETQKRVAELHATREAMSDQEKQAFDMRVMKSDPVMYGELVKFLKKEARPDLSFIEKRYMDVGKHNRAQAIWEVELSAIKDDKQFNARLQELVAKRVATPLDAQRLQNYRKGLFDEVNP